MVSSMSFSVVTDTESFTGLDNLNLVKLAYSGKVISLSQFSLLPQLSLKMKLAPKVTLKQSFRLVSLKP